MPLQITVSDLARMANRMRPGEKITFARRDLIEVFRDHEPSLDGHPKDRFLSLCIGSMYGVVRWQEHPVSGDVTISKHDETECPPDAFFHIDYDRQPMFVQGADGMWRRA